MEKLTLQEQLDLYYQNLLKLQFGASEDISHNPTKGSMREEFIKDFLEKSFPQIKLGRGLLTKGSWQSTQIDLLKLKPNARVYILGGQNLVEVDDCMIIMEIKSNGRTKELEEFEEVAKMVKGLSPSVMCGIFCYNIDLTPKTLLERFGFKYKKKPLDLYIKSGKSILYPHIDFIFTLEAKKEDGIPYLIIKNIDGEYYIPKDNPVIKHFLDIFKDIS
ncbi:DUF6602 domain-containing protein [Helicobacter sp. 11S02596-1]|uniref:DUF6602 domain-containing protein n=1 Tax=Helicobacter sp. 11S02596-1 TaxID=1476194 RepID=UPI000BA595A6|nr:DUF6602 domain-containing protein [Helicobacter sp. 11S02596-1]PAF45048.1 hypothetical protein BJI48_00295 [Helicobacter sp. 11S02596-1]